MTTPFKLSSEILHLKCSLVLKLFSTKLRVFTRISTTCFLLCLHMPELIALSSPVHSAAVTQHLVRLFSETFPIAKFLIVKPVRVEPGALVGLFHPNVSAGVSPLNDGSPRSHHLRHPHLSVRGTFLPRALCAGGSTGCNRGCRGVRVRVWVCAWRSLLCFRGSSCTYVP